MSRMREDMFTCAVCGKESGQAGLDSLKSSNAPDLDFRPATPARELFASLLMECPHCGYVHYSISRPTLVSEEYLRSKEYRESCPFHSYIAQQYYKQYLIARRSNNVSTQFYAMMHAAWACDDAGDIQGALTCRRQALFLLDNNPAKDVLKDPKDKDIYRADLLRRTRQFTKVIQDYGKYRSLNGKKRKIMRLQCDLARQHDDECHSMDEI